VFPLGEGADATVLHPLVVFGGGGDAPKMPHDMEMIAVELKKSGSTFEPKLDARKKPVTKPLPPLTEYGSRFGGIFENFHPNEIFAVLFAAMVTKDHFDGRGLPRPSSAAGEDFDLLRTWCRTAFASATPVEAPK
jgi:hypothetical protein